MIVCFLISLMFFSLIEKSLLRARLIANYPFLTFFYILLTRFIISVYLFACYFSNTRKYIWNALHLWYIMCIYFCMIPVENEACKIYNFFKGMTKKNQLHLVRRENCFKYFLKSLHHFKHNDISMYAFNIKMKYTKTYFLFWMQNIYYSCIGSHKRIDENV